MKPSLIIDCSITMAWCFATMAWCFADEATAEAAKIQDRLADEAALVPGHWHLEVVNVLAMAERRQRISSADSSQFLQLIAQFDIQVDDGTAQLAFAHLPALCRTYGLTSYDAAYLDLAVRRQLPLATLDKELQGAAAQLGVPLLAS